MAGSRVVLALKVILFSGLYVGQSSMFEHGGEFFHGERLSSQQPFTHLRRGRRDRVVLDLRFPFSGRHGGASLGSELLGFLSCL